MNMGFGGGMPSFGGNPFGGFGGGMPQMPQMPQMQPPQQFGAQPNFTGYGGPQAPTPRPSGPMPGMGGGIANAIACGPPPGMGGGAMGAGRGKGRTGPGMSGGFSGGMPGQPQPMNQNMTQTQPTPTLAPPQVSGTTPMPAPVAPTKPMDGYTQTMNINDPVGPAVIPWS